MALQVLQDVAAQFEQINSTSGSSKIVAEMVGGKRCASWLCGCESAPQPPQVPTRPLSDKEQKGLLYRRSLQFEPRLYFSEMQLTRSGQD